MRRAIGFVLIGILSVQFGAAIAKDLFDRIDPTAMVFLRLLTSALVLLAFARPALRTRCGRDWQVVAAFLPENYSPKVVQAKGGWLFVIQKPF